MDQLKEIYDRINYLRKRHVKMKEMAARCDISSSVFSAIYTTVIPHYLGGLDKGLLPSEALDGALVWVNNVSKKRLLGAVAGMRTALQAIEPPLLETAALDESHNPFPNALRRQMADTCSTIGPYAGTYMSYSVSSSRRAMKAEPLYIAPVGRGRYVEVVHASVYDIRHYGFALLNGRSHLYLTFNELTSPQLALYNVCVKLPMYDRPPLLRGVYTCFDYNYNPIARRILLVRMPDTISREAFMQMRGRLLDPADLTAEERIYFDYTCGTTDVIRLHDISRPQMTATDLMEEKRSLGGDV